MPNIPKAVRTIKPHIASPMYCAICLKFAVAVISSLFLIFLFFNADSRAEGVEFQTILSASRLSDIFFMRLSVASVGPCIPVQSRNYLCAQNGNDYLMRLTERRENGGKRKWRQIGQENFKREIRKKGKTPKGKGT